MSAAAPAEHPFRRLLPHVPLPRRDLAIALGAAVAGQTANGLGPVVQKVLVDAVLVHHTRRAWPWLVALAVLALATFGFAFVRRWIGGRISLTVQHELRNAIYGRLLRLDFAGHDQLRTGQLVSRASGDLGLVQQLLAFLPLLVGNIVLVAVSLVSMAVLSPPLTVVALVALPVMAALALRMRSTVFPATWDAQQRAGEVAGVVDEAVTGVRVVKGFAGEEHEIARLAGAATGLYRSRVRLLALQAKATSSLAAVPAGAQVVVLVVGGWMAVHGRVSLGTFLAFSTYLVQLVAPMRMMANVVAAFEQARAGAVRLLDIIDANSAVVDAPGAVDLVDVRGDVRFDDVRFGYRVTEPVLDGFTLHVRPGEVVALVGGSGSGKSTVAALLPRFYDVAGGSIRVDGVDVRDVTLSSLRSRIGVAFEEAFLFSDTVRANIAYGAPDATDAQIEAAARIAGAHDFVAALPAGYRTVVGERGLTLSGGQRQRLALARAVVSDPSILVLDDATSAVDTETEESIHAALRSVLRGRTTILVAHRASTVRLADRVVLLERGRVVAEGSHDELLAAHASYRELLGEADAATVVDAVDPATGTTPSAWPEVAPEARGPFATVARHEPVAGGNRGGRNIGANLAATPQLLAALDRLAPATDDPHVDLASFVDEPSEPFRLRRFVAPWRGALGLGLALVATDALLTVLGPLLVRHGLDAVRRASTGALWAAGAAYAVVTVLDVAATWLGAYITGRTAERVLLALRVREFAHLQRLSLDYYDNELDGRIMTRMTSDIEALAQLVQSGLVNAIVGGATCVGVAVFLVVLSPWLALATSAVVPPLVLATWWYQRRSSVAYRDARRAIADVNARLQEGLSGVRVTQAFVHENRDADAFRRVSDRYYRARLRSQRLLSLYFPGVGLLADLAAVVVLGAGAALVVHGRTTPSVVIAFVLYLNLFFAPIQQLSQVFDTWQQAQASIAKITELLCTPSGTPEPPHPRALGALRGELRLEGVHYAYPGSDAEALSGVDLVVHAGERVALVGETGAGKSTVVRLLARFQDPSRGRVLLDGVDLRDLRIADFRHRLGVVPQEPFLFSGTVRDNIAYGRPDATDAEVEAAARAVGAHDVVARLPAGYRTPVDERGRSLSAGQRQLLALARAQLVDPVVLLLDEATASLDQHTEARVRESMSAIAAHRTTVLVAHRLSTARAADRIAVLDAGRVVETGTHEELLARDGRYASLWRAHVGVRAAGSSVS